MRILIKGGRVIDPGRVNGPADVLIENGKICHDRLRKELMTVAELAVAAHKQGFTSLDDVDRAVLEPGGVVSFFAKKPTAESTRHAEILERLDAITNRLAALEVRAS